MFSDENPLMQPVKALAEAVRATRQPVAPDNPLLRAWSRWPRPGSPTWLRSYRQTRDAMTEAMFLSTYGSPLLQAHGRAGHRDVRRRAAAHRARPGARGDRGTACGPSWRRASRSAGCRRRLLRALIYVRLPERSVDERGFAVLQAIRAMQPAKRRSAWPSSRTLFTRPVPAAPPRRGARGRAHSAAAARRREQARRDRAGRAASTCSARAARLPEEGTAAAEAHRGAVRRSAAGDAGDRRGRRSA